MKYEEIIRKFIKSYKSKRELKNELEKYKNEYSINCINYMTSIHKIENINCKYSIDRYDVNYLNEQQRNIQYEQIMYNIKREMFEYIVDNNLIKIHKQFNVYENKEEFIGFLQIVR